VTSGTLIVFEYVVACNFICVEGAFIPLQVFIEANFLYSDEEQPDKIVSNNKELTTNKIFDTIFFAL